ncbi:MAG TPA: bifunctional nuclease family protein [Anaeromyxobacteraceae bacterium]|nr:bifunctional nuclease family protein [Anaeromyxobacteraceae bacterium]
MHAALAAALLTAPLLAAATPHRAVPGRVPVEVMGVLPLESDASSLLVLREKGGSTVLPIFMGRAEATAIEMRLKQAPASRPVAGDLLEKTIAALGGKVLSAEIRSVASVFFDARVTLQQGERQLDVEARASDAVALAVRSRAPIFATRQVMEEAGLTEKDLERFRQDRPQAPSDDERRKGVGPETSF